MSFKNFAHLLGIKPKGAEGDDEDEKAKKAKGKRAEEDDEKPDAEDDDDKPDAEDDDDDANAAEDDDEPEGKKAKGKKAQDDDEDEADAKVAKGRRMERKRCAAIFGSKAAGIRPDMAASLAFHTSLSASQAVNQLEQAAAFSAPQGGRMSLDERMQGVERHRLNPDAKSTAATGPNAKVTAMVSLYNSAKGIK